MADFMGLMKQAAQLQSKMEALQAELDTVEVEGTAGGGLVTVKLTGKGDMKGVKIDDSLMKPVGKGNSGRSHGRRACRCAPEGRSGPAGKDEGGYGRPAVAARSEAGLICLLRLPDRKSSA